MKDNLGSYIPYLIDGLWVTLEVFALGSIVWLIAAFVLAFGRMSRLRSVRFVAGFVVETFRGSSALVQLFWAYYVLPLIGVPMTPLIAGVLVLGLNEGSYASEIVRGSVQGLPKGQTEAATVLGLSPWQRFRHVVLPQAFATMIPPFGSTAIDFLQLTSFVSLVTVLDLTARANLVQQALPQDTTSIYVILLFAYFAGALIISAVTRQLELAVARKWGTAPPAGRGVFRGLSFLYRAKAAR
jgi:polar amino acid transport system permease protein